jgi:hypothetical protein
MSNINQETILNELTESLKDVNNIQYLNETKGIIKLRDDSDYDFEFELLLDYDILDIKPIFKNTMKQSSHHINPFAIDLSLYNHNKIAILIMETIHKLACNPTKIIMQKGYFFLSFGIMYLNENSWEILTKNNYFRFNALPLPHVRKEEVYYGNI